MHKITLLKAIPMNRATSLLTVFLFVFTSLFASNKFPRDENVVRIMSYNVHNCDGTDNVFDYKRIANIINRVEPDVISLQELDSVTTRNKGVFSLKELSELTDMHYVYARAINFQGGAYGIGLLSKEKPIKYYTVPLPGREEGRVLLIVEFDKYVCCAVHLSLTEADQKTSVSIIQNTLKNLSKPVFLAGDMNSVYTSETQAAMRETFKTLSNHKRNTYPSNEAKECIDYIYAYNDNQHLFSVIQNQVLDEKIASDHLPLFTDVRIAADATTVMRTKPYLQNPSNGGITVSWLTNVPVHSWVEYGTDPQKLDNRSESWVDGQSVCNNKQHKVRLKNLKPATTYYYRVCSREITLYEAYRKEFGPTVNSEVYSFSVPDSKTTDFTAIIMNDLHKNKKTVSKLAGLIKDIDYDMVIFNGDCIDDPRDETSVVDILSYMNEQVHAENKPVYYIRGNHEIRNAYSIQLRDLIDYVGGNTTYGAFSWGDSRFVLLDCGEDKPDASKVYYGLNSFESFRQDQTEFLKKELSGNTFKKAAAKVLIHHIPLYGMSSEEYVPCKAMWQTLLNKASFNLAINAHTHSFAFHQKGEFENNYPVVIGGGPDMDSATVMILKKKNNRLTLSVLDINGKELLNKEL